MRDRGLWVEVGAFVGCGLLLAGIFAWNQAPVASEPVQEAPREVAQEVAKEAPPTSEGTDVGAGRKITAADGKAMMEPRPLPFMPFRCPKCMIKIMDVAASVYTETASAPKETVD